MSTNTNTNEEDVDWNNNQQSATSHNEQIDKDQFDNLQQEANNAANTTTTANQQQQHQRTASSSSPTSPPGSSHSAHRAKQPMSVPVASLAGGALNSNINNTNQIKKSQQLSNNLLDSSRKVTTRERQRDREYKKTLMQQERGNADVDYSNWESGNAPDAMSLRVATAVTELVRDAFANVTAMRREIRQRNVDALANGSPLSEEAGRAVQEAMQSSLYPLTTGLVNVLEDGLRSVMPLFSSSMRNTEGLNTLVQIRDQLGAEAKRDVDAAKPSSSLQQQQQQEYSHPHQHHEHQILQPPSRIPLPPTTSTSNNNNNHDGSDENTSSRSHHHHHQVSRLDSHPVYDREQESDNHMQKAMVSPRSLGTGNSSSVRSGGGGGSAMNTMVSGGTLAQPILTTISQVESKITENAEPWPADHRRHQAHSTIHQRIHPTKADAARRVNDVKTKMMHDHHVESIIPPALNKLVLASLPQSARVHSATSGASTTTSTTTTIAEMKRQYKKEKEAAQNNGNSNSSTSRGSPNISARRKQHQIDSHEEMMARYPTNTVDGFAARILSLHDPKLSNGIWRQLSVNEKQQIVAFEQRENRYHHMHGVTNMKLAGLRMKVRRSRKIGGVELSAGDYAALAEAERKKKILEEQRECDVRQTAMVVKSWLPPIPEKFERS